MEDKQKIKLLKEFIGMKMGVSKVRRSKINKKGEVKFFYDLESYVETNYENIDSIIQDGIKQNQENIKFLKNLLKKDNS